MPSANTSISEPPVIRQPLHQFACDGLVGDARKRHDEMVALRRAIAEHNARNVECARQLAEYLAAMKQSAEA